MADGLDVLRATVQAAAAAGGHGLKPEQQIRLIDRLQAAERLVGHWQTTDESGTWCHETCPMPDEECGRLALLQNDPGDWQGDAPDWEVRP